MTLSTRGWAWCQGCHQRFWHEGDEIALSCPFCRAKFVLIPLYSEKSDA